MATDIYRQEVISVTEQKAPKLNEAAAITIRDVLGLRGGEEVLILTNPDCDAFCVAKALFDAALAAGGKPVMALQERKNQFDYSSRLLIEAIKAGPDVLVTCCDYSEGRDSYGANMGYVARDGRKYDHIAFKLAVGDRRMRWIITGRPGIVDLFERCVAIDYDTLRSRAQKLKKALDGAQEVRVTSPAGTDVRLSLAGRRAHLDVGDLRTSGTFGNLPCGEIFYSPAVGSCEGTFVFDGTIALDGGCRLPDRPVTARVHDGFITEIEGGEVAMQLLDLVRKGEQAAKERGLVAEARNTWHVGEMGIGLNPEARVCENMLEAEKAFHTAHFAIGMNIDGDASAMVHLDCLLLNPSIWAGEGQIMKDGELLL